LRERTWLSPRPTSPTKAGGSPPKDDCAAYESKPSQPQKRRWVPPREKGSNRKKKKKGGYRFCHKPRTTVTTALKTMKQNANTERKNGS